MDTDADSFSFGRVLLLCSFLPEDLTANAKTFTETADTHKLRDGNNQADENVHFHQFILTEFF